MSSFDSVNGPSITVSSLFVRTRRFAFALGASCRERTSTPALLISVFSRVSSAFCFELRAPASVVGSAFSIRRNWSGGFSGTGMSPMSHGSFTFPSSISPSPRILP